MVRLAPRLDRNHHEIVEALLECPRGSECRVTVINLAGVHCGVPDLLVGVGGKHTFLCELKDGEKSLSRQALTPDQRRFIARWEGTPVVILNSADQARAWVAKVIGD